MTDLTPKHTAALQNLQPFDTIRIGIMPRIHSLLMNKGVPCWPFCPDHNLLYCGVNDANCQCLAVDDTIIFMGLQRVQIRFVWNKNRKPGVVTKQVATFLLHGRFYWTHRANFEKMPMQIIGRMDD